MFRKRGLIYLLVLLFVPIVYSQSVLDGCSDGTTFGYCQEGTNQYCGNRNLISNSGFESDSNDDGIPDNFLLDPNAVLNRDVSHSDDAYTGEKSIRITKQWASFDHQISGRAAITLQPNTEYLFFAFVKGSCNNIRVFSSTSQTGRAENRLCDGDCTLVSIDEEWSRLITQFNSNTITTIFPEGHGSGNGGKPFLSFLRLECADEGDFELYVDKMNLQTVEESPTLIESCQTCGSCPSGLSCSPEGSCIESTEDELMLECVASGDFGLCQEIPPTSLRKPIAVEQFALHHDSSRCEDELCVQKDAFFDCKNSGNENCDEQYLTRLSRFYEVNPGFKDGGDVYIRYFIPTSGNKKIERFKLAGGRDMEDYGRCEIHVRKDLSTGNIKHDFLHYSLGTIIPSTNSNILNLAREIRVLNGFIASYVSPSSVSTCETCDVIRNNFPWPLRKDCGRSNCNLLEGDIIAPKADLLCGYDTRWYLCDQDGIKTFENGRNYACHGDLGIWTELT